jgi:hypothetical protein
MNLVLAALFGIAAVVWIAALVSAIAMVRYRKRPLPTLLMNGMAFFDRANFEPAAEPHRRRLILSAAVFAGVLAVVMVVSVVMLT